MTKGLTYPVVAFLIVLVLLEAIVVLQHVQPEPEVRVLSRANYKLTIDEKVVYKIELDFEKANASITYPLEHSENLTEFILLAFETLTDVLMNYEQPRSQLEDDYLNGYGVTKYSNSKATTYQFYEANDGNFTIEFSNSLGLITFYSLLDVDDYYPEFELLEVRLTEVIFA